MLAENGVKSPTCSTTTFQLVQDVAPNTVIFHIRENTIPKSHRTISVSDQIRFTFLFLPIVLVTLQSVLQGIISFTVSMQSVPFSARPSIGSARG